MTEIIVTSLLVVFVLMTIIWLLSVVKKDMSIVDVGWGFGFMVVAVCLFFNSPMQPRQFLISFLIVLWGTRLAVHILVRNWGKGEDPRYQAFRTDWGKNTWWISYFKVFLLQGVLMLVALMPVYVVMFSSKATLNSLDWAGVFIWLVGWLFESIADYQLYHFKQNPINKGKVMDSGLWHYSRHPNYFGEALLWWGIFIISISSGNWYVAIIGPSLITFLLLKVSGVTMLEKRYDGNDKYAEYKRKTSTFFPLPPKQ